MQFSLTSMVVSEKRLQQVSGWRYVSCPYTATVWGPPPPPMDKTPTPHKKINHPGANEMAQWIRAHMSSIPRARLVEGEK